LDTTTSTARTIRKNETEYCGKVPLHQTNQIQPHGAVLVIETDSLTILQASENINALLGSNASAIVNTSLDRYISAEQTGNLKKLLLGSADEKTPLVLNVNDKTILSLFQPQRPYFIMEMAAIDAQEEQSSFVDFYQEVKQVMKILDTARTTEETCTIVARELKRISGFDKIMIYQFDEDWNGAVIAEEKEEGMESYLGLKFPASDIPKQARDLYQKSPYRLIPNVDYKPEKLYPLINPLTHAFTDLTPSNLRSVAAVHLEYLRNMNVAASMSTRILKEGQLWGLISCHHRTPKYVSYQGCSVFEMLSAVVTAKLSAVQYYDAYHHKTDLQVKLGKVMELVYAKTDLMSGLIDSQQQLMALLGADGIAITNTNQTELTGVTPSRHEIEELVYWLQTNQVQNVKQYPNLSEAFENASAYAKTSSGLLCIPIAMEKGFYLLAFRSEEVQKIDWGGNPNEAVQFGKDHKNYHPRNSFKLWQEAVYNKSIPWDEEQMQLAQNIKTFIQEYALKRS
jgi:chemotaxis family two-component system sensor kinase Cph1